MMEREIVGSRTIDWSMLEQIDDLQQAMALIGAEDVTPWRHMFDGAVRRAHRELKLEFLSTFRFRPPPVGADPPIDPLEHIAVRFSMTGQEQEMTYAEWAVALGFYSPDETGPEHFYTDVITSEQAPLSSWWPAISDEPFALLARTSQLRDPLYRYIHRCIAGTISGWEQMTEQVTYSDLFFLRSLIETLRTNVAGCMATYLQHIHPGKVIKLFTYLIINCLFVSY
jgi:hypothetical protein